MGLKNLINQINFYRKKYGIKKTIKKCISSLKYRNESKKNLTYGGYGDWFKENELFEPQVSEQRKYKFEKNPKISIIVPMYNTPYNFFEDLVNSCLRQSYSNWELCLADGSPEENQKLKTIYDKDERIKYKFLGKNEGISGNTNEALKMATGDYIALLDHDDVLADYALFFVAKYINKYPDVQFLYSDEDKIDENGNRYDVYFKPDFAIDTLRSQNYICHFSIFKKELMDKLEGFRSKYDGAQDYDIFLRMSEITDVSKIKHISRILYHWRVHSNSTAKLNSNAKNYAFEKGVLALEDHLKRIGLKGNVSQYEIEGIYRIDYELTSNPKVSIVIPNKDGKDILEVCINSILEKTTYQNYNIIVVENNSETEEIFNYYKELEKNPRIKVVKYPEKGFNYPAIINFGVRASDGEYIVQLNNDTELITSNWIELMLGFCQRPDVGGVGVKLYYPDDTIQHAGIIIGLGGVAGHRFKEVPRGKHGYFAKESMIEDLSAVTAACIMNPKSIYEEVGYMDEGFAVAFNDVDFCLKIRKKGYFIIYNPHIEFTHYESKSRGLENTPEKIKRFQGEISRFKERWQDFLDEGDPYYNINLSLDTEQYHIKKCKVNYKD